MDLAASILLILLNLASRYTCSDSRLVVKMTLVHNASKIGGFCLDGSLPAYHLHRGFGAGARNWLLQFEGGGWCNDIQSCLERAQTRRGSTLYMNKLEDFNGILSNNASLNPDFYNWNRVKLRYCDGGSFSGDAKFDNGTSVLYFRGKKIWEAIILDLLPQGLMHARKALLSGCSAGGLSSFLHCENFARILPRNTSVKCLSDAGFFMDERDIALNHTMRNFFENLVSVQGIEENLNKNCTSFLDNPKLCMFPQYFLRYITAPIFILNTAYDVYQVISVPAFIYLLNFSSRWCSTEVSLASDKEDDKVEESKSEASNDSDLESKTGTQTDLSSSPELNEAPSENKLGDSTETSTADNVDYATSASGTGNNDSFQEDLQNESSFDDKSVDPEMTPSSEILPSSEIDASSHVSTFEVDNTPVKVEPSNVPDITNLNTDHKSELVVSKIKENSDPSLNSLTSTVREPNEPVGVNISDSSPMNTSSEPQIVPEDDTEAVASLLTKENLNLSNATQNSAERNSSALEVNYLDESDFSGTVSESTVSKVYPAMYIENVTELAFDDIKPDDPDFSSIQGLAEAGFISSKLSNHDLLSSSVENQSPFYFAAESTQLQVNNMRSICSSTSSSMDIPPHSDAFHAQTSTDIGEPTNLNSSMGNSLAQDYLRLLNTADKQVLKKLKGIGEKRATYILELREDSPEPFKNLDDLKVIGLSAKQVCS
ncbi:hypothetical protein DKX38_023236 [Salix brachista]|uniref:Pectin acetylesterase n=1 Tax=Salix brachista TaxID=2182728 RepID=A0A5N5KCB8_9ROSI|nr:hypothetical protein DKX38_023236 [Salix brachista]